MGNQRRMYIDSESSCSGGEDLPNQSGPFKDREPEVREITFLNLYREKPDNFFIDSIEIDEELFVHDKLYLAVIRYSTGDTFGTSFGCHHIVGLFATKEDAQWGLDWVQSDLNEEYKPWEGYFERLSGTEIHELNVI